MRNFAATAALLAPPAHSKTIRARKATERALRDCRAMRSNSALALGLPPAHASSAVHDETPCLTIERLPSICNLLVTQETSLLLISLMGGNRVHSYPGVILRSALKSSIRGEVNKKHFTLGRIFVDFQPRLLSSRICPRFGLQRLGMLRTTAQRLWVFSLRFS